MNKPDDFDIQEMKKWAREIMSNGALFYEDENDHYFALGVLRALEWVTGESFIPPDEVMK